LKAYFDNLEEQNTFREIDNAIITISFELSLRGWQYDMYEQAEFQINLDILKELRTIMLEYRDG